VSKNTRHYIPFSTIVSDDPEVCQGIMTNAWSFRSSCDDVTTHGIRYFTLAHEVAQNLVQLHIPEREFYFSAICAKYLVSLSRILNTLWLNSGSV